MTKIIGHDLLGDPIHLRGKHYVAKRGHAGNVGAGPEGEKCKTCRYLCRVQYSKSYIKCKLTEHKWTCSPKTDIRVNDAACEKWEPKIK